MIKNNNISLSIKPKRKGPLINLISISQTII